MKKAFVALLLLLPAAVGCGPNATTSTDEQALTKEPKSLPEVLSRLKPMIAEINDAISTGNPTACDEELHDAMFLANRIPRFVDESPEGKADDAVESSIRQDAERLFQLLMTAHNAAHGGEFTVDDEVVTEQELAEEILATYQRLVASG